MSLINRMLQDLEKRRASGHAPLPAEVRPLPAQTSWNGPKWLAFAIVAVVACAAALIGWRMTGIGLAPSPVAGSVPVDTARPAANRQTSGMPDMPVSPVPSHAREGLPPAASIDAGVADLAESPTGPASDAARETQEEEGKESAAAATLPVENSALANPPVAGEREGDTIVRPSAAQRAAPAEVAPGDATSATYDTRRAASVPRTEAARLRVETRLRVAPQQSAKVPPAAAPAPAPAAQPLIDKQPRSTPAERADAAYRVAMAAMERGRKDEAMPALLNALREDGAHAQARMALSALLAAEGRLAEAQNVLEEGLAQGADSSALIARLARIMVERERWEEAASMLGRHLSRATYDAQYRALHAGVLQHLGRHAEAVQEYRAALALSPQAGAWWMGLGLSLEAEGKTAQAREALLRARATGDLTAEVDRYVAEKLVELQSHR